MSRPFIAEFLMPLVNGGKVEVGRPISERDVASWRGAYGRGDSSALECAAARVVEAARRRSLLSLVSRPPVLELDEATWRLGASVHNLLALSHPRIAAGPGAPSRIERVASAATTLARLGAPASVEQALARHSVVARLPEVARVDHTVRFWLGRRTFLGRRPPARLLALPRLRAVRVETVRRTWMRDIGVQAAARAAFAALTEASPLGEALDPLRLDPPWSWARALSVLKFPVICRLVAGRLLQQGVAPVGDALVGALYRYVSLQDSAGPVAATPAAVAFAVRFLAHLTWLDHLFGTSNSRRRTGELFWPPLLRLRDPIVSRAAFAHAPTVMTGAAARTTGGGDAGRELAVLLSAALSAAPELVWPPDVPRQSGIGRAFARYLDDLFERHQVRNSSRTSAAIDLVRLATAVGSRAPGDAV